MEKISTRVVNLFAGPSAGKSTNAFGLMHYMKKRRMNAEIAPEYAKEIVWGRRWDQLDDQIHIFGEQQHRQYRLLGQVDWIVTDSPLLLSSIYYHEGHKKYTKSTFMNQSFHDLVLCTFNQYDNYNFYVDRGQREFIQAGRTQDKERSLQKDTEVKDMLDNLKIPYTIVPDYETIVEALLK